MTNEFLFTIFGAQIKEMAMNKIKDAYELLEILFGHLTCNCFFREIDGMVNGNLLTLKEKLLDDARSYENNVINGFVYLRCKEYDRSRYYLTNAIRLNKNNFLAYALRSEIENSEIKLRIKDAEKAVALNPNQRNYFQFARVQSKADSTDQNLRKSIQLYQNAIDLNPRFACAISNQGILLQQIRDKESIILSCENSLKSNKKHWEREWLCKLYYEEGRFKEAKKHLTYLVKAKPERLDFLYMLAETQDYTGEEVKSVSNYCKYYEIIKNLDSEEIVKPFTYNDLRVKLYEVGKEAEKHLFYLVKAKPEQLDFLLLLAETQEYTGEEENALSNYCKYYKAIQSIDSVEIVKPFTYNSLCMKFYELGEVMFKKKKNIEFKDLYEKFIKLEGYERCIYRGKIHPDSYLSAILTLNNITKEDVNLHKYYFEELWSKYMSSSDKSRLTIEEKDLVEVKEYYMHDRIIFGKYNGKTIIEIVDVDSNYLMRTILTSARFCVTNLFFMIEEVKEHPFFCEALARNTAKRLFIFDRESENEFM